MKSPLWMLALLALPLGTHAATSIQYDLKINNSVYDLVVQEVLPASVTFSEVAANFRNPELFKVFNPSITSLVRDNQTRPDYHLTMGVTKLGVTSYSVFECNESWDVSFWERTCVLQTNRLDGGKFMANKTESSSCKENNDTHDTTCTLHYHGQMKDIAESIGPVHVTLMKAPVFVVQAKYTAMNYFAQMWMYNQGDGSSAKQIVEKFNQSDLAKKLTKMLNDGTAQAKVQGNAFDFNFHLQD